VINEVEKNERRKKLWYDWCDIIQMVNSDERKGVWNGMVWFGMCMVINGVNCEVR